MPHDNTPAVAFSNTPAVPHANTLAVSFSNTPAVSFSNTPAVAFSNMPAVPFSNIAGAPGVPFSGDAAWDFTAMRTSQAVTVAENQPIESTSDRFFHAGQLWVRLPSGLYRRATPDGSATTKADADAAMAAAERGEITREEARAVMASYYESPTSGDGTAESAAHALNERAAALGLPPPPEGQYYTAETLGAYEAHQTTQRENASALNERAAALGLPPPPEGQYYTAETLGAYEARQTTQRENASALNERAAALGFPPPPEGQYYTAATLDAYEARQTTQRENADALNDRAAALGLPPPPEGQYYTAANLDSYEAQTAAQEEESAPARPDTLRSKPRRYNWTWRGGEKVRIENPDYKRWLEERKEYNEQLEAYRAASPEYQEKLREQRQRQAREDARWEEIHAFNERQFEEQTRDAERQRLVDRGWSPEDAANIESQSSVGAIRQSGRNTARILAEEENRQATQRNWEEMNRINVALAALTPEERGDAAPARNIGEAVALFENVLQPVQEQRQRRGDLVNERASALGLPPPPEGQYYTAESIDAYEARPATQDEANRQWLESLKGSNRETFGFTGEAPAVAEADGDLWFHQGDNVYVRATAADYADAAEGAEIHEVAAAKYVQTANEMTASAHGVSVQEADQMGLLAGNVEDAERNVEAMRPVLERQQADAEAASARFVERSNEDRAAFQGMTQEQADALGISLASTVEEAQEQDSAQLARDTTTYIKGAHEVQLAAQGLTAEQADAMGITLATTTAEAEQSIATFMPVVERQQAAAAARFIERSNEITAATYGMTLDEAHNVEGLLADTVEMAERNNATNLPVLERRQTDNEAAFIKQSNEITAATYGMTLDEAENVEGLLTDSVEMAERNNATNLPVLERRQADSEAQFIDQMNMLMLSATGQSEATAQNMAHHRCRGGSLEG